MGPSRPATSGSPTSSSNLSTVAIVDSAGTFEQHDEPSYDLWLERADGSKLMRKHVRQSELEAIAGAGDDDADGQA